jgi:membrane protein implicated in regulation of membrane protease activity
MSQTINYFIDQLQSGSIFWFCALAGSGMFVIQLLINLFVGTDPNNFDADTGSDAADVSNVKWLSLQTIAGFLMIFGWTALTCNNQFSLSLLPSMAIAITAGIFAAYIIRALLKLAKKLHSPGTSYRIEDAIGCEAYVYQTIPKGGRGKISISLQNFTHEIDAISHHLEELPSFTQVTIIEKKDDNTVVVAPK